MWQICHIHVAGAQVHLSTCFAFPCHRQVAFDDVPLHPAYRSGNHPRKRQERVSAPRCQPLPLITVPASRAPRLTNVLYRMASVDDRGPVADRQVIAAVGWNAGTRLRIRKHDGLLVVTTEPHGVLHLTKQGYLRLPADARRAASVSSGDRVLLTAHLERRTMTVFPPAALDSLVLPVLLGGEDACAAHRPKPSSTPHAWSSTAWA